MKRTISIKYAIVMAACVLTSSNMSAFLPQDKVQKASDGLCSAFAASSDVAKTLAMHPQVKSTYKNVCCKLPESWRTSNKNTVEKALDGCAGIKTDTPVTQEDLCSQVALAGGLLSADGALKKSIDAAKKAAGKLKPTTITIPFIGKKTIDLGKDITKILNGLEKSFTTLYKSALTLTGAVCCQYPDVMEANPKAAKIFGCPPAEEVEGAESAIEEEDTELDKEVADLNKDEADLETANHAE